MQKIILTIILFSILILSACSNTQQANRASEIIKESVSIEKSDNSLENIDNKASNVKEFNVKIGHTSYTPNEFKVKKGDKVRFLALASKGTASHNHGITIDEFNVNQAVVSEDNPAVVEFTAEKSGTFIIYCKTCWDGPFGKGHPDIKATLIVE